jgi:hypothetical protein
MKSRPRHIPLVAIAAIALFPAGAAASPVGAGETQLHGDHSQSPGAYICGINYTMNSVDGKYCLPRHATRIATRPPASAAPAKVVVRDSGFAWGDAAAGAGATLVIVLLGAGTATAAIRRHGAPSRVNTTS